MKITDGTGKILKAGLPNMKQALFHAYNTPECLIAVELRITPETELTTGDKNDRDRSDEKTDQTKK
ncbi:MAG: hypothetical protein LBS57_12190 [Treponema sp.]|jgi:hypothetical protein|nr:hypothetical protein [Treponema sp.]